MCLLHHEPLGRPSSTSTAFAVFLSLLLAGSSLAKPPPGYVKKPDTDEHPAKYEFGYEVNDGHGSHQGHEERRDGELAEGRYFVDLPDGSTQTVSYTADDWGFHPLVTYTSSSKTSSSSAQIAFGEKAVAALRSGQTAVTKLQPVSRVVQDGVQQKQQQELVVPIATPQPVVPVASGQPVTTLQPVQQQQIVLPLQQQQVVVPVRPQIVQQVVPVQPQIVQPVQTQVVQPVVTVQPHIIQPVQQQLLLGGVVGQGQAAYQQQSSATYQQAGAGVSSANLQLGTLNGVAQSGRLYQPRLLQGVVSAKAASASGYRLAEEVNSLVSSTATPVLVHQTIPASSYAVLPSAAPLVQEQQQVQVEQDEEEYRETSEQRIDFNGRGLEFGAKVTGSVPLVAPTAATLIQVQQREDVAGSRLGLALRPIVVADHVVTPSPTPTALSPIIVADFNSASVGSSETQFVTTPRPVVTVTSAGAAIAGSGVTATPDTVIITPRPESVKANLRPAEVKEEGEDYNGERIVEDGDNSLPLVSTPVPVFYAQGNQINGDEELHAAINALDDVEVDVQEARSQEKLRAEHQVQLIKQALAETDARIQEQELKQARLKAQIDDVSLSSVVKTQIPVVKYHYVQQHLLPRQQQQLFVAYGGRVQSVDKEALTKLPPLIVNSNSVPLFQQENRQILKDELQGSFEGESAKVSVKQLLEAEKIAEVSSSSSTSTTNILPEVEKPVEVVRPLVAYQQQQPYVTVPVSYQPLVPSYSQLVPVVKDYHYQQPSYNNYFHNNKLQHQQQFLSKDLLLYHGGERYGVPRQRLYPTRLILQPHQQQQQHFRYLAPNLGLKKPVLASALYGGGGGGRWRIQQGGGTTRNQSQLRKLCIEYGGFKPPIVPSKQIEEDLELDGVVAGGENKD